MTSPNWTLLSSLVSASDTLFELFSDRYQGVEIVPSIDVDGAANFEVIYYGQQDSAGLGKVLYLDYFELPDENHDIAVGPTGLYNRKVIEQQIDANYNQVEVEYLEPVFARLNPEIAYFDFGTDDGKVINAIALVISPPYNFPGEPDAGQDYPTLFEFGFTNDTVDSLGSDPFSSGGPIALELKSGGLIALGKSAPDETSESLANVFLEYSDNPLYPSLINHPSGQVEDDSVSEGDDNQSSFQSIFVSDAVDPRLNADNKKDVDYISLTTLDAGGYTIDLNNYGFSLEDFVVIDDYSRTTSAFAVFVKADTFPTELVDAVGNGEYNNVNFQLLETHPDVVGFGYFGTDDISVPNEDYRIPFGVDLLAELDFDPTNTPEYFTLMVQGVGDSPFPFAYSFEFSQDLDLQFPAGALDSRLQDPANNPAGLEFEYDISTNALVSENFTSIPLPTANSSGESLVWSVDDDAPSWLSLTPNESSDQFTLDLIDPGVADLTYFDNRYGFIPFSLNAENSASGKRGSIDLGLYLTPTEDVPLIGYGKYEDDPESGLGTPLPIVFEANEQQQLTITWDTIYDNVYVHDSDLDPWYEGATVDFDEFYGEYDSHDDSLLSAGLVDESGASVTPSHNFVTTQAQFEALIHLYARSIDVEAELNYESPNDADFSNGVTATVDTDEFTWNVLGHGADLANGTGPHATRDGQGLSFTDEELSAIRSADVLNGNDNQSGYVDLASALSEDAHGELNHEQIDSRLLYKDEIDFIIEPSAQFEADFEILIDNQPFSNANSLVTPDVDLVVSPVDPYFNGSFVDALKISAQDAEGNQSDPADSGYVFASVDFTPVDDLPFAFTEEHDSYFSVNAGGDPVVAVLPAFDRDGEVQTYSFKGDLPPELNDFFALTESGQLTMTGFGFDELGQNQSATKSVTIAVTDGINVVDQLVNLEILGVNDRPTTNGFIDPFTGDDSIDEDAVGSDVFSITYDQLYRRLGVNDVDQDAVVGLLISNPSPTLGDFELLNPDFSFDALKAGGILQWTPAADVKGDNLPILEVQATDGIAPPTLPVLMRLDVNSINDLPVIAADLSSLSGIENTTFSYQLSVDQPANENPVSGENPFTFEILPTRDSQYFEVNSVGELSLVDPETDSSLSLDRESSQYIYEADLRITDSDGDYIDELVRVEVLDIPNQILRLSPLDTASEVVVPGDPDAPTTTTSLSLELDYNYPDYSVISEDAPDFSVDLSFDASALVLDSESFSANEQLDFEDIAPGRLRISTDSAADFVASSLGSLTFKIKNPETPLSYPFVLDNFSTTAVSSSYESTLISRTVAPNADVFIGDENEFGAVFEELNFSQFTSGVSVSTIDLNHSDLPELSTLPESGPYNGVVRLVDQGNYPLTFTEDVSQVVATNLDDALLLDQSLDFFDLQAGDDTVDLRLLSSDQSIVDGRLGLGRDKVLIDSKAKRFDYDVKIEDFELGFDSFVIDGQTTTKRSTIIDQLAADGELHFSRGLDIRFASIVEDLNASTASHRSLISGQSPLFNSSLFVEPGSNATELRVLFSDPGAHDLTLAYENSSYLWSWSDIIDDGKVIGARLKESTGSPSLPSDLRDFRQQLNSLVVSGSSDGPVSFDISWLGGSGARTSLTHTVGSIRAPRDVQAGKLDFSGDIPVNIELMADVDQPRSLDVAGSTGDDVIILRSAERSESGPLLSDALATMDRTALPDKAYGFDGDDLLIGYGTRLVGGSDNDNLIASSGDQTTQLLGNRGDDVLIGAQNDVLVGGHGSDTLIARGSGVFMTGGRGQDDFVLFDSNLAYHAGSRPTTVMDLRVNDRLIVNMSGIHDISGLVLKDVFGSTHIYAKPVAESDLGAPAMLGVIQGVSKQDLLDHHHILFNTDIRVSADILSQASFEDHL